MVPLSLKIFFKYFANEFKYFIILKKIKKKIDFKYTNKNSPNSKKIILCELNNFPSAQIPMFYLVNFFSRNREYKFLGFYNYHVTKHFFNENIFIKFFRKFIANFFIKKIYFFFGIKKIIYPELNYSLKKEALKSFINIKKKVKKKEDMVNLKVKSILIGDLFYDSYCKKYFEPTLDINDYKYDELLKEFLFLFHFWYDFIKKNKNLKKILTSHSVYSYAIISRVGLHFNKKVYSITIDRIKKLNKKTPYELHYKDFSKTKIEYLKKNIKKKLLLKGKKILTTELKGQSILSEIVSTLQKNSFSRNKQKSLVAQSNKIKILISPHDFFDAPHVWGDHKLFPDYYEWLKFLMNISKKTNYDWYLKSHPNFAGDYGVGQRKTRKILKQLFKDQKNIKILPPNYSNYRIVKDNIDIVITCHGSVAYEFPYFKIPTITTSECSPFKDYNFNVKAKSKQQLKEIILNLNINKYRKKINRDEIFHYFSSRFVFYNTASWLFDYTDYTRYIKGWVNRDNITLYYYWLKNFRKINNQKVYNTIKRFLKSNSILLNKTLYEDIF